jgi:hypothetical protein
MLAAVAGCHKSDAAAAVGSSSAPDGGTTAESAQLAASKQKFTTTVRPILQAHCASCHASTIKPLHSSPDVDVAYEEIMTFHLVDFTNVKNSRLYTRLAVDNHQCWGGDCVASAGAMLDALTAWAAVGAPAPDGPPRHDGPAAAIAADITQGAPNKAVDDAATELSFTMATPGQGPVVFTIKIEKFDPYSYRLFLPSIRAPEGVTVSAKGLQFILNDGLLPDGSFALLDATVAGKGASTPVVLDPTTTMILLMDKGPGADHVAPSFVAFDLK